MLQSVDMSTKNIKQLCVMYGAEDFVRGARGTANYIKNNIMTNLLTGEPTAVCTDISRKMFYVNMNGTQIKDPNLNNFYDRIEHIIDAEICKAYEDLLIKGNVMFSDIQNGIFLQMKKEAVDRNKVIRNYVTRRQIMFNSRNSCFWLVHLYLFLKDLFLFKLFKLNCLC